MSYEDKVDFIEELWSLNREDIVAENRAWAIREGFMSGEEFDSMFAKCERIHFHNACVWS